MRLDIPRQVGIVAREARLSHGLTQADVAEAAHVSRQLVNRIEIGHADGVSLAKLIDILDAVGCRLWAIPDDEAPDYDDAPSLEDARRMREAAEQPAPSAREVAMSFGADPALYGWDMPEAQS